MEILTIGTYEVALDPADLDFTEATLNEYLQKAHGKHAYYVSMHTEAQFIHGLYKDKYEQIYSEKYAQFKESGATEKLAEAKAKIDPDVMEAMKKVRVSEKNMRLLAGFLRSLDKANENAINLGYNKRKELEKLGNTIFSKDFENIFNTDSPSTQNTKKFEDDDKFSPE